MTTQTLDFEALAQVMGRAAPRPRAQARQVGGAGATAERRLPAPPQVLVPPEWEGVLRRGEAVLARIESDGEACVNCGGAGRLWIRHLRGGPYGSPPGGAWPIEWLDATVAPRGEGWYEVETVSVPCPVCAAGADARRRMIGRLRESCGLKPAELAFRMDFIEHLAQRLNRPDLLEGKREALDLMGRWVAALPAASGLAFLYGPPGVGKSGLAMAYVAAAVNLAVPAAYVTVPDLIKARRATMSGAPDPLPGLLRATVLVLDEVDRVGTEWERHELFTVLDARARVRFSAATVLVSNRTPEELRADGFGYLVSRLLLGEVAAMGGADLRALVR